MVSLVLWFLCFSLLAIVEGSGVRLVEPQGRGVGSAPNCGGVAVQWDQWKGRCGVCGDDWGMKVPRPHETGGEWGEGELMRNYIRGQVINITVQLTEDLGGYFNVKICPLTESETLESQSCLDTHPLQPSPRSRPSPARGHAYWPHAGEREVLLEARLPEGLTCSRCVLQWSYFTGNISTGSVSRNKNYKMFRSCSDISIQEKTPPTPSYSNLPGPLSSSLSTAVSESTATTFINSTLASIFVPNPQPHVSVQTEGKSIYQIFTLSRDEGRKTPESKSNQTLNHSAEIPTEDTLLLNPHQQISKMSELDNSEITVTRNVIGSGTRGETFLMGRGKQEKHSETEQNGSEYQITRPLAPALTFPGISTENKTIGQNHSDVPILNVSEKESEGFYPDHPDQKEKPTSLFNKTLAGTKEGGVNATTNAHNKTIVGYDSLNQTKEHSFVEESEANIGHDNGLDPIKNQTKLILSIHTKPVNEPMDNSEKNSTRKNDEIKSQLTLSNPTKNELETGTNTAVTACISVIVILICLCVIFILYIKKLRPVLSSKKPNNSTLYDEAPTRWSDINLSLPADYEVVPTADPDNNPSTILSVSPPPPTFNPDYASTLSKPLPPTTLSPDYANIPDVVPLSARSRTNASSPNLHHQELQDDSRTNPTTPRRDDGSRTNPSTPRRDEGMLGRFITETVSVMGRCQSQHLSENNIERDFGHDENYSKSQEDVMTRGMEEGSGNSSTFPPVAPCRRKMKKTLYTRISQRWGSEDWEKDESFLAMLAVRLNRMQSRPEITEL